MSVLNGLSGRRLFALFEEKCKRKIGRPFQWGLLALVLTGPFAAQADMQFAYGGYTVSLTGKCAPQLFPDIVEINRMTNEERLKYLSRTSNYRQAGEMDFDLVGVVSGGASGSSEGANTETTLQRERYFSLVQDKYFRLTESARKEFNACVQKEIMSEKNFVGVFIEMIRSDADRVTLRIWANLAGDKKSYDFLVRAEGVKTGGQCRARKSTIRLEEDQGKDLTFCRETDAKTIIVDVTRGDGDNRFVARLDVPAPLAQFDLKVVPRAIGSHTDGDVHWTTGSSECGAFLNPDGRKVVTGMTIKRVPQDTDVRGRLPNLHLQVKSPSAVHWEVVGYDDLTLVHRAVTNKGDYTLFGGLKPVTFMSFDRSRKADVCVHSDFHPKASISVKKPF